MGKSIREVAIDKVREFICTVDVDEIDQKYYGDIAFAVAEEYENQIDHLCQQYSTADIHTVIPTDGGVLELTSRNGEQIKIVGASHLRV